MDTTQHSDECARYIRCWRRVGDVAARKRQLEVVLHLGQELDRLTRMFGLRTLLKMMRGPAAAAGLNSLQHFLESGFDASADMRSSDHTSKPPTYPTQICSKSNTKLQ